jgi:putative spermidine/putrescine transport system substrate-binding protein/spermidine/putrescine transport system substrate-binding protein
MVLLKLTLCRSLRAVAFVTASAMALANTSVLAGEVRLFTFEGYADDDWADRFEQESGCTVNVTYTGSVDEMFAKMKGSDGSDYDLISIDTSLFERYNEQGLLKPYDMSKLENTDKLMPEFQSVKETMKDGNVYGLPIAWGSLGLIYDVDEVKPAPTSWEALWDENYKDRIIVLDDTNNNLVNAAIILGYPDPFNLNDDQMQAVKQKLIEQKKVLLSYFAGFEEGNNVWESGDVVLMFSMGEFQAVELRKRGYNVEYIIPQEGGVGWLDTWAMSKGVKDSDCAHAWMDYFLQPWVGKLLTEKYGYGNTTSKSEGLDYADRLTWLAPAEDFNKRNQIWNEVKAAVVD